MSDDILCNFHKCQKKLTASAYITVCSHAFCEDHGADIAAKSEKKCSACDTTLARSFDLVTSNLNPTEQFKSMVLAGLRPEIIIDIANRGLMFWGYQKYQEYLQQEANVKTLRETIENQEVAHSAEMSSIHSELEKLRRKQKDLEMELQAQRTKNAELCEKINWKDRDVQKYQQMCETMKKKQLSFATFQQNTASNVPQLGPQIAKQQEKNHRRGFENVESRGFFDFRPNNAMENYPTAKVFLEDALRNGWY